MTTRTCDVAIIGAGTAGLHAYKAARDAGADVLLIERGPGGSTCTWSGCIPSKLLIAAARAAHDAHRAGTFGVRAASIAVDGAAVMARVRAERDRMNQNIVDEYRDIPAAHRLHGEARFTGPTTLMVGDTAITAGAIVVAAGARPQVPDALKPVEKLVHTHETIFDLTDLPETMAVIGAGPLGLELAQAFARLGVDVTVLDKADTIGGLDDPEAERAARDALGRELTIRLGVEIAATMAGGKARVSWSGTARGAVMVDCILAATGRAPDLDALDLTAAKLALDDEGVPIFDHATRRCGDTSIFLAGDVDGWRPVLHEAARGGRIAGEIAAGDAAPRQIPDLAIAFTDPNLVQVGMRFHDLPEGASIGTAKAKDNARAQIDAADAGLVRLYADRDGLLLGATIVASGGEHLGQQVALALDRGMDAATFADQAWYHPVIEEMLQAAARDIGARDG